MPAPNGSPDQMGDLEELMKQAQSQEQDANADKGKEEGEKQEGQEQKPKTPENPKGGVVDHIADITAGNALDYLEKTTHSFAIVAGVKITDPKGAAKKLREALTGLGMNAGDIVLSKLPPGISGRSKEGQKIISPRILGLSIALIAYVMQEEEMHSYKGAEIRNEPLAQLNALETIKEKFGNTTVILSDRYQKWQADFDVFLKDFPSQGSKKDTLLYLLDRYASDEIDEIYHEFIYNKSTADRQNAEEIFQAAFPELEKVQEEEETPKADGGDGGKNPKPKKPKKFKPKIRKPKRRKPKKPKKPKKPTAGKGGGKKKPKQPAKQPGAGGTPKQPAQQPAAGGGGAKQPPQQPAAGGGGAKQPPQQPPQQPAGNP
ncbi:hypothetical protein ACFL21_00165 [Patescibacteria group bacterium]